MKIYSGTDWPYPDRPTVTARPDPPLDGRLGFPIPGPTWPYWPAAPWLEPTEPDGRPPVQR